MREKIKSLSKQTLIYGTSTIVGRFLNFLLVPFYTNIFPPSEYGIITLLFAYIAMLNIFYSLGFESGYFKFASTLEVGDKKENFSLPFFTILFNALLMSVILYSVSNPVADVISLQAKYASFVKYSAIILFFDAICLVPFANLRLQNKAAQFTTIKIINIVINVGLNIVLVLGFKMGLESVFISNIAASVVTFILLMPVVVKNISFKYNAKLFDELWRFSLPYVPAGLASIMVQVVSRPIMQYLTDEATVGIFQANYRLGIFMMLLVGMFEYAWRPFFLNNAKEPNAKEIFAKVMTVFVGFSSIILIVLSYFIEDIIKIPIPYRGHTRHIIGSEYWGGIYIVPLILFSYLLNGIYINLMAGIYIEKKTKYLPFITGLGAAINILFNILLIPKLGLYGAAFATVLSYASMTIYIYLVSQKFYPVKYESGKVYAILGINAAGLTLFFLFFYNIIPNNLFIKLIAAIAICFLIIKISGLTSSLKLLRKKA
jgi:O-antigen/teichoic acid export membrane protein